ncbi:unnamed protein product [Moneuplotes crassus]|uniref:Uncharacterized protein n=1 Tax=Euplotes crassus TaxID=5936 RepID=A0AAD1XI66_EUPCR|nr:unnamed protein product [Moneuplotes crassus]
MIEYPAFLNTYESAENFTFLDDDLFMAKNNSSIKDFPEQPRFQPEDLRSLSFPFEPDQTLALPQERRNIPEVGQEGKAEEIASIDVFTETKPQSQTLEKTQDPSEKPSKKKANKRKSTDFGYLLERKSFRMMRKYYKDKFQQNIGDIEYKRLSKMTTDEINIIMSSFMENELGSILICLLSEDDHDRIRDALKTIIFCDRYQKKEAISEGLNFSILRNVLHKYNTRNLIDFLSDASNSFVYTHYFLKEGKNAAYEQSDNDSDKLLSRMRHLMKEASNYLPSEINEIFEEIYASIFNNPI